MSTIVKFFGRFGNNIFQLSAALKLSNGGEVLVNPGRYTGIDGFENLKLTWNGQNFRKGYYQDRRWLLPKEEMLPYIKKVSAPSYEWVLHIRGGDYIHIFNSLLRSREHILYQLNYFKIRPENLVIVTDDINYTQSLLPDKYNILHSDSFIYDWWILRNAKNIILSPGTFSYTAAYLGDHDRVIMPRLWPWDLCDSRDITSVRRGIDLKFDTWELEQEYKDIKNPKSIRELLLTNRIEQWKKQQNM